MRAIRRTHRPLIGIPMRQDVLQKKFYLQSNYSEAIAHAGGVPILIPLIPERKSFHDLVSSLDGVVLSGSGSDLNPELYGDRKIPQCGDVHPSRDATDFLLLEETFKRKLPLLAICFGIQSLNVFLGGTLIQDIPTQCPGALPHETDSKRPSAKNPEHFCSHLIQIERDSLLFSLARGQSQARVNSSHHQAIRKLSPGLKITASAPDGIIEGVELKSRGHFVLGTQWHPEKSFEGDLLSLAIFKKFVEATSGRK